MYVQLEEVLKLQDGDHTHHGSSGSLQSVAATIMLVLGVLQYNDSHADSHSQHTRADATVREVVVTSVPHEAADTEGNSTNKPQLLLSSEQLLAATPAPGSHGGSSSDSSTSLVGHLDSLLGVAPAAKVAQLPALPSAPAESPASTQDVCQHKQCVSLCVIV